MLIKFSTHAGDVRPPLSSAAPPLIKVSTRAGDGGYRDAHNPRAPWPAAAAALLCALTAPLYWCDSGATASSTDEPVFSRADVAAHASPATRVWVTFRDCVYDVTDFVPLHPGGAKILLAAGGAVDPFWMIYQQHKGPHVEELLAKYRIGRLAAADAAAVSSSLASVGDPYCHDPHRSPLIRVRSGKPFNGEPPASLLPDAYVTPTDMLFVRNHLPVPDVEEATFELVVEGPGAHPHPVRLTLGELKARFPRVEVVAALQCAGNRRAGMGARRDATAVRGLGWDVAAMGNLVWAGARLRDGGWEGGRRRRRRAFLLTGATLHVFMAGVGGRGVNFVCVR